MDRPGNRASTGGFLNQVLQSRSRVKDDRNRVCIMSAARQFHKSTNPTCTLVTTPVCVCAIDAESSPFKRCTQKHTVIQKSRESCHAESRDNPRRGLRELNCI